MLSSTENDVLLSSKIDLEIAIINPLSNKIYLVIHQGALIFLDLSNGEKQLYL